MKQLSLISTLFIALILTMNTHAHTGLESSVPSNNAMLMESLDKIELRFASEVNLIKLDLVNKEDGQQIPIGYTPTTEAAASFSHPLPGLKIGTYQVNWTAMGADGHKMEGNFSFMMHVDTEGDAMTHSQTSQMHDGTSGHGMSSTESSHDESNHSGH